jgi:anti-sigma-K factor RskA
MPVLIPDEPGERSATAAEYVMGTLTDEERAQFEQSLARDFALQQDVYYWQDKLLPMTRILAPVEPSAHLWERIERALAGPQAPVQRWWENFNFWRYGAIAASLLAVGLALRLMAPATAPETLRYVAVLQSTEKTDASWIVEATPGGKLRLTPIFTATVPPQKALQFWTKAKSASGPTSLGLVPPDRVTEIDVARLPALEREQLFELTLEPEGGSTIGRPTGPILYVGRSVAMNMR